MNKNIKRIIAITLILGAFSPIAPTTNFNLLTTNAYASDDDAEELDSISLQDDDGNSLNLYKDDDYGNEVDDDLDVGNTYYAVTTTDSVRIESVSGADDDKVRIFKGSDDEAYEVGDSISLTDDTTTLKVRVYEDDYDDDDDYNSSDYNEYKVKVEYTGDDDLDDDDYDNDEDTLDSLELDDKSGDSINLYSDSDYEDEVNSDEVDEGYTYYAKTSSDKVSIETSGPSDDYVRVFKSTGDSATAVETGDEISVSENKTLTVKIYDEEPDDDIEYGDNDDVIGEYKIKLKYTGDNASNTVADTTSTSGNSSIVSTESTVVSSILPNQWVQVNGCWQYNDGLGKTLKNQWFFDRNYEKWYYLGADGIMASNYWILSGGRYYYLGYSGAMATNSWILSNGKYYYVGADGAMAINTTVSGYKVGSDGAWLE